MKLLFISKPYYLLIIALLVVLFIPSFLSAQKQNSKFYRDGDLVEFSEGMFHFDSWESLNEMLTYLYEQQSTLSDAEWESYFAQGDCLKDDLFLDQFEEFYGVRSLRMHQLQKACSLMERGEDPEKYISRGIPDPVFAALVNEKGLLSIADSYYYMPSFSHYTQFLTNDLARVNSLLKEPNSFIESSNRSYFIRKSLNESCEARFVTSSLPNSLVVQFHFDGEAPNDVSYIWYFGDGKTSTAKDPVHTYEQAGSYTIRLDIVTGDLDPDDPNFCSDTYMQTLQIGTQDCTPTILHSETGTGGELCFSCPNCTGLNVSSYQWNFGDGNTSTSASPCHVYSCDQNYIVELTVETQDGCKHTLSKTVDVNSFACCDRNPSRSKNTFYNGDKNRILTNLYHLQIGSVINRIGVRMVNYEWKNNKWKRKKDMLKIQSLGNVYMKDQTNCSCTHPHSVAQTKVHKRKSLNILKGIGDPFKAKFGAEWYGRFYVDNNLISEVSMPVNCE